MSLNKFYIYLHRRLSDNKVFYVGKGSGNRHKSVAGRSSWWKNIVNKHGFYSEIVFDNLEEQEAFDLERDTILEMKYHFEGFICNLTEGGEGTSGIKQKPETIAKRVAKNTGKKRSEESRRKISMALTGKKKTEEEKVKMSEARKGIPRNPDAVAKTAKSNTGKKRSEKFKKEQSERAKEICKKTKLSERTTLRNMDKTIYIFEHPNDGIFVGTRLDFCTKFAIRLNLVSNYFHRKQKSVLGWKIRRKDDN